ncbi:hypothetical protein [Pleurocapsa sp. PCC 7319]|uniref:hypothetical protein n=1 Tax=Pleurocapsa sp. PCC 7319 TaxID=118161 RepID=UPI00034AAA9B|nr:hypothetical protein [Pleurocapsa sp. PCC 7319]
MPQELNPEQRLTQIEKILESAIKLSHTNTANINANSEAINRIGQKVEANTEVIAAQDTKIDRLTEQMGRATEMFVDSISVIRTMQTNIETIQSEIRGLQVENRRILDRLFGEENP